MAYISQETKKILAPAIKAVLKEYDMKGTISVRDSSVLTVKIKQGSLDFGRDNCQIHHSHSNRYQGKTQEFIEKLFAAMKGKEWYDNSDSMSDYFDTAYYMRVQVGDYDTPYKIV